jgi:hypothetical protein
LIISTKYKNKKKDYTEVHHFNNLNFPDRVPIPGFIDTNPSTARALIINPPYPGFVGVPNIRPPSLPTDANSLRMNRESDLAVQDYNDPNQFGLSSMPPCVVAGEGLENPKQK